MTGLTWLHLSDWHQTEKKFNRKVVCAALIEDIKNRKEISPDLSKIDFIIFSGDVANSGQLDEYKKVTEDLFKPILEACNLSNDRLFIVPGNHDLDRDLIPASFMKILATNEEVDDCWGTERKRTQLFQPFQEFYNFLKDCTGHARPEYCSACEWDINGKKIGLLGINSAWLCARHKDEIGECSDQGYLCVGESQIFEPLEKISKSDIKIAVLHHPLDWLAPFDSSRVEVYLKRQCNFILHGHAHKPGISGIRDHFGYYTTIPAGACYDRSNPTDSGYTYSYNYIHLDLNTDKGIIFLRKWSNQNRNWKKDDETFPPNGEFDFSIFGKERVPIPHQIPPPPRDFKGREKEIDDILSNFEKGATITSLRGMGGVGKTALALVLADKIKSQFPDGQIFIEMRGTSKNPDFPSLKPDEAMAHIIRAFNPADKLPENSNELRGLYHSMLAGKRILLLLDNAAGSEQVEPLLPPKGCSLLITSRIKFALQGLKEIDLDILPPDKAQELLLEIAPRISNRADQLAKLCGYLPLALRNAAKALTEKKDLGISEYEQRLRNKMERLELVKASFSTSYDLLSPGRKKQWRRLSVFPEDFDRNAATAIVKMAPGPAAEALSDLVQWSLVDFVPMPDSEGGRYKLHDLARLFAESCLEPDELADAQQKHAKYYSKILSQAETLYEKDELNLMAGLDLFDREWANIKVGQALVRNIIRSSRRLKKSDLKFVLQLARSYAGDAVNVLDLRLHPRDKIEWIEIGLKAARMMGDESAEGVHLSNLGSAYADLGETRKAIDYYEQALKISREIGNRRGEGVDLGGLGNGYAVLGETRKAIEYHEQALKISREIGDRRGEGVDMGNLGNRYAELGETRKAIEYHEQALKISREIGDRRGEGANLGSLGNIYADLGEIRKAIDYYEQALKISQEIGDRRGEGADMGNLGLAYAELGENRKAIDYHEQALKIAQEIGDRQNEGEFLCNLGKAYFDLIETSKAIEYCTQSLDIVCKIEYRKIEGEALCTLGKVYSQIGEFNKAIDHCDHALEIFQKMEYRRGEAEALFYMSQALDKLSQRPQAIECAQKALQIFEQIESPKAEKVRQQLAEWQASSPQET